MANQQPHPNAGIAAWIDDRRRQQEADYEQGFLRQVAAATTFGQAVGVVTDDLQGSTRLRRVRTSCDAPGSRSLPF